MQDKYQQSAYDILNIKDGDISKVKVNYVQLIREFTPEKSPEKFMQIRKAYEELNTTNTSRYNPVLYKLKEEEQGEQEKEDKQLLHDIDLKNFYETPFDSNSEIEKFMSGKFEIKKK